MELSAVDFALLNACKAVNVLAAFRFDDEIKPDIAVGAPIYYRPIGSVVAIRRVDDKAAFFELRNCP